MPINVPFLSDNEIALQASSFLDRFHNARTVPVPIEKIVEFGLGLDIVPVPGLLSGARGINGYLSSDRTTIFVDEGILEHRRNRYLFTLAHEVGHLVLHEQFYRGFTSDEDWTAFRAELLAHKVVAAEVQANKFANLIMLPDDAVKEAAARSFEEMARTVLDQDSNFDLSSDDFWSYVAEEMCTAFNVSSETMRIGLQRCGVWGRRRFD